MRDTKQALEWSYLKTLEILADFLRTIKKQPNTITIIEYQQRVGSKLNTLSDVPRYKQTETLTQIDPTKRNRGENYT